MRRDIHYSNSLQGKMSRSQAVAVSNWTLLLVRSRTLRSSAIPLLVQQISRTDFPRRAFRSSALSVWNSLTQNSSHRWLSVCF